MRLPLQDIGKHMLETRHDEDEVTNILLGIYWGVRIAEANPTLMEEILTEGMLFETAEDKMLFESLLAWAVKG